MIYLSDATLDDFIKEDLPYFDLTTKILGIGRTHGRIEYYTRNDITVCGTEEAARIFIKLGVTPITYSTSGSPASSGETFLVGEGSAESLHAAWKVCTNLLEHCSGIATKTYTLVQKVKQFNPHIEILTTRKSMPGTRELVIKSILAGGALPHRLGLSETILIFKEHLAFYGGVDSLIAALPELKKMNPEKKIIAETEDKDEAIRLARNGIDGIQFDKVAPAVLKPVCEELLRINPAITLLAAGGINEQNAEAFALCGISGIVTSSLYSSAPADIGIRMRPLSN